MAILQHFYRCKSSHNLLKTIYLHALAVISSHQTYHLHPHHSHRQVSRLPRHHTPRQSPAFLHHTPRTSLPHHQVLNLTMPSTYHQTKSSLRYRPFDNLSTFKMCSLRTHSQQPMKSPLSTIAVSQSSTMFYPSSHLPTWIIYTI
jgi:hypothetical protein